VNQALNILLIDDNPDDRALAIRELRREFPGVCVRQIADSMGLTLAIEMGDCDCVITDYQLRWMDGLAVLSTIKANWPECPVIMFTGTGSEEIAVEAMKAGLDDYVLKSAKHYRRLAGAVGKALERASQRRALRELEANYRALFAEVPSGLYKTTPAGRILDANATLIQMLGHGDREALLSLNAAELYAEPAERRRWQALMERDGVVRHFETRLRRSDGTLIWVEDNSRAVCNTKGEMLYYEGSLEDISERLNLESQLLQAQKMESVGKLAAGIAHDFNNVLTVIKGHTDLLLRDGRMPLELADSLRKISSAADRAANVTHQLLTFSQRQTMQRQELDLNQTIRGVVAEMEAGLRADKILLRLELSEGLPAIHADANMMGQMVANLAANAHDAMREGGTLWIRTESIEVDASYAKQHPDARAGAFVCLNVSDSGRGMDPEMMRRIFDPFFSTKEVGKGSGLGLTTVYGIIHLHQGWTEVISQVGQGTLLKVFLPAKFEPDVHTPDAGTAEQIHAGAGTILVVEDEPELRLLARQILEYYGYRVLEASGSAAALEAWPRYAQEVDLLLTDMVMPEGVTGWELATKLREQKPDLRVICTSGYNENLPAEASSPPRGVQLVHKPFEPQGLAIAVRECLDA